jgi:hypothetical protein
MLFRTHWFLIGFLAALLLFAILNVTAAHLRSDCGIRAVVALWLPSWSPCSDDIVRVGFPLLVLEQGGFAYHSYLYPLNALLDGAIGLGAGLLGGAILQASKSAVRRAR